MQIESLITDGWQDYRLLDSGLGRKLERCGPLVVDRPEPQALWPQSHPKLWRNSDAVFSAGSDEDDQSHGRWTLTRDDRQSNAEWINEYDGLRFHGWLTNFRHVGYFPEQVAHWRWLKANIKPKMKILNLFAYSGVHSLIAAQNGASVTHVDASKKAITWAKDNQALNDPSWPIRWIVDDAMAFVQREARRGNLYDGILLDPPKFGRGPDGEVWDLFIHLPALLESCNGLLSKEQGSFLLLTAYAIRASSVAFAQAVQVTIEPAQISCGELFVQQENGTQLLPTSMYVRAIR
jgi:23S rRNA (cytosine1962-C5)-methyltransferase